MRCSPLDGLRVSGDVPIRSQVEVRNLLVDDIQGVFFQVMMDICSCRGLSFDERTSQAAQAIIDKLVSEQKFALQSCSDPLAVILFFSVMFSRLFSSPYIYIYILYHNIYTTVLSHLSLVMHGFTSLQKYTIDYRTHGAMGKC